MDTNKQPAKLSHNQSQMDGGASLSLRHPKHGEITYEASLHLLQRTLQTSLPASIGEAFDTGNNLRFLRKACGNELNVELVKLIQQLAEALQCKVGMATKEDYLDAVAVVHDFPAMTIEEVRLCFAWVRQGKIGGNWYERFKAPQLREVLCEFEALRAERYLEPRHKQQKEEHEQANNTDLIRRLIDDLFQSEKQPYSDDWLKGKESRMSKADRAKLQERDRTRKP